ncbi:Armadillo-type fold [Cynara cardunculus var. scolymus]|uniref:RING-type E3 ubiquitin transferase n=1 Tax=Cynara cardunculus var. scolymus TaxID=59895 RepID=A0A103YDU3_CYNCS|nr:Armadillo-type fold [Cynara cardunculus var. scolymus]
MIIEMSPTILHQNDRLLDQRQRALQKEQCGERLAAEDESSKKDTEVRYSDQAVLANLDWGMDALEEAINTSNLETKIARLDHAEKMLQVCAMLNSTEKTAGVPNFYLSAWAHLNLSYLWKLRNNATNAVLHVLEMFSVDPFFSRIDFAPEIWKTLFLPHMSSIVGWYSEERHRIMMDMIPDSADLSFTADFDQYFNESLVFSMRPDQAEKLQNLEKHYGESLDENTRNYANYFKDCMNYDQATSKKAIPMLPIAEPPMTPLHEVSQKIPDYVRFGPILPKSAGFSPKYKLIHFCNLECNSLSATRIASENLEDSAAWDIQEGIPEETDESDYEPDEDRVHNIESLPTVKMSKDYKTGPNGHILKEKNRTLSPVISRKTSPKVSSSKQDGNDKVTSTLTLRSTRAMDFKVNTSLPTSPPEQQESVKKKVNHERSSSNADAKSQASEKRYLEEYDSRSPNFGSPQSSERSTLSRPPKDFVCPITSHVFSDPVTLETGQTYERKAIEEWMKRGNTTCPITRQSLSANELPKTNYVLKRLITSWKEQHVDLSQELSYPVTPRSYHGSPSSRQIQSRTSNLSDHKDSNDDSSNYRPNRFMQATVATSPTSVISQAAIEAIISGIKPFITCLCTSEDLKECEAAVLTISRMWKESNADPGVHACLSTSKTVNGLIDVLSASLSREVLRTTVYVLSELLVAEERLIDILTNVDLECLAALLKNGLDEAAVLIYLLKPTFSQLSDFNLVPYLIQNICSKYEDSKDFELVMNPKDAAIELVAQVLTEGDESSRSSNAMNVMSANAVPSLVMCLDKVDTRQSVIYILLCCIHADRSCRNIIASRIDLCPVLELFHAGDEYVRGMRTFCNQILQIIKDEGAFSTMHTLLVYLQSAPMEQHPVTASLLLQLDLLVEPRKMSIYREEAIETLIESLQKKDFPNLQLTVLDALTSLSGHLSASGTSLTEAWLLKLAGFDQPYEDFGRIFNALEECLKSNSIDMTKKCLATATWLIYMLYNLPDTGIRGVAQGFELDTSMNGEVLSLLNIKGRVISSHSDGTIKVWDTGKKSLRLIQEVREHAKAVHDVKEVVHGLTADANFAYFFSQGAGVKVYGWSGVIKNIGIKQTVKSLAMIGNKLYCGCNGFSILEVDLRENTTTTFYSGARKFLGKQSINSLHIQDNLLFMGGTSIDGAAGKVVFSLSSRAVVGSLQTGFDIQLLAVNNDFIFGATKSGIIEVWLKERLTRVASIKNAKITSLASDADGEMLFAASSDGRIQGWDLD